MADDNGETPGGYPDLVGTKSPRDTVIQIILSVVLGVSAFLAFCVLRPRWTSLYAARKQKRDQASPLPELSQSFFGWVVTLWYITEQQILASAGLDAYVFLRFFKMAMKCLTVTLFFALVVIKPVHDVFPDVPKNSTSHTDALRGGFSESQTFLDPQPGFSARKSLIDDVSTDYLWMYLVFAYLFTGLALYLIVSETESIIGVRQEYLGHQSTVTDRTIRLSGIPSALRSEEKIKAFVEGLEIGNVDSVMLCKKWEELDDCVSHRMKILRKLETSWTVHAGRRAKGENDDLIHTTRAANLESANEEHDDDEESGPLLGASETDHSRLPAFSKIRPRATIRYGFLKLRSRYVDAIDYYEEKLRQIDEKITELRKRNFEPTPIAFVTMDSVASAQMAVQAVLDPSPMQLMAKSSPAPGDVVWRNTYMPRTKRMLRGWTISVIITVLTVFWSFLLVPVAFALNIEAIGKVFPRFADFLDSHPTVMSLVTTQLPTLLSTLLFVAVPYLYDWLANLQGMMSQSDVELSVVSKNFFFTFFNYFVVFTTLGTFANFFKVFEHLQESLKDPQMVANQLARSLQSLLSFYTNLIILQGVGLFPFRLLQFGSVFLYPIYKLMAKTPRDYAELNEPPVFNYGFFMPQVMLIFIICIVYSVLRESWRVLLAGLIYFAIGGFVYKYQLLYAMDHRQHSTGRAWVMICRRMITGLLLFQATTAGQLLLKLAFKRAFAIVPLIVGTLWFNYVYGQSYDPLMQFIALRSIERKPTINAEEVDPDGWGETARLRYEAESHPGHTVDNSDETGKRFINPSLVAPLEDVWITDNAEREITRPSSPRRRLTSTLNAL